MVFLNRFEDRFRYDDEGLPRVWNQNEDIDAIFVKSKEAAEELVTIFAKMPVSEDVLNDQIRNDPVSIHLIIYLTFVGIWWRHFFYYFIKSIKTTGYSRTS